MLVRFRLALTAPLLAVVVSSPAFAQRGGASHVLDRANLDTTCAPCADFYEFANGDVAQEPHDPADKSSLGSFGMLGDKNQEVVQKIVVDDANLVSDGEAKAGSNDWKIGTYYIACMDTVALDKAGFKPIKPALDAIAAAKTTDDIVKLFGTAGGRGGGGGGGGRGGGGIAPFSLGPGTDPRNSKLIILSANQGGLSLNRDDYLGTNDRAVKRRADYEAHVTRSLELLGESETQAAADAKAILGLETSIAKITIPQADMRDPVATYHKMSLADFQTTTPHFNWTRYLQQHRTHLRRRRQRARACRSSRRSTRCSRRRPSMTGRSYLRWHVVSGAMGSLSAPFRNEAFRWQQVTSGVKEQERRSKQCATATNGALGEAVGQDWIKRNFSPEAKARAAKMVDNLVSALRDRINGLDWMSSRDEDASRRQAQRVHAQSRVPRQVARLLDASDQAEARTTRTSTPWPNGTRRAVGRGWARRRTAPSGA